MKIAAEWVRSWQQVLDGRKYAYSQSLDVMIRAVQQEAFQAGFEAGREKAAVTCTEYAYYSGAHGCVDASGPHAALKQGATECASAIRAIPTPEMPTEGEQGNG